MVLEFKVYYLDLNNCYALNVKCLVSYIFCIFICYISVQVVVLTILS